jgi:hypothetical protein
MRDCHVATLGKGTTIVCGLRLALAHLLAFYIAI